MWFHRVVSRELIEVEWTKTQEMRFFVNFSNFFDETIRFSKEMKKDPFE